MTALVRVATLLSMVVVSAAAAGPGEQFRTFSGLTLGSHDFADVQARLGEAPVHHVGDAGESQYSLCYSQSGTTVTFGSGELGGPGHELLSIRISALAPRQRCGRWPSTVPLTTSLGGLQLGMNKAQFARALGHEPTWNGTSATAVFESTRQVNGVTFDVVLTVEAGFTAGKLSSLTVWRTETN